jgi:hypothetical protein
MSLLSVLRISPSPQALLAAVVFPRQLLLTEHASATVGLGASDMETRFLALWAKRMSATLEDRGYTHSGINE